MTKFKVDLRQGCPKSIDISILLAESIGITAIDSMKRLGKWAKT